MSQTHFIDTDIAIIGGGTAGCYAALTARRQAPELDVLILEKAHIDRSGCLAGGMNAINAYINPGETVDTFVDYVRFDAMGVLRESEHVQPACRRRTGCGLRRQRPIQPMTLVR